MVYRNHTNNKPAPRLTKLDQHERESLFRMICHLIAWEDHHPRKHRIAEMGTTPVTHEMLPEGMDFHAEVLRILEGFAAIDANRPEGLKAEPGEDTAPTAENVTRALKTNGKWAARADELMRDLRLYEAEGRSVTMYAFMLHDAIQMEHLMTQAAKAIKQAPFEATAGDAYIRILDIVQRAAPAANREEPITISEGVRKFVERSEENYEIVTSGKKTGVYLPIPMLNRIVPRYKKGQMTSIVIPSNGGKTTFMSVIGEHIAHKVGGFDFLLILVEMEEADLTDRRMSNQFNMPTSVFDLGYYSDIDPNSGREIKVPFDIHSEAYWSRVAEYHNEKDRLDRTMGRFIVDKARGGSPAEVLRSVSKHHLEASAAGRQLVVGIDYIQAMAWEEFSPDKTHGFNRYADFLKDDIANNYGVHVFVASQANDVEPESPTDYGKMKCAYGNNLFKRSQNYYYIYRPRVDTDEVYYRREANGQIATDPNGKMIYHKDAFGRARFLHQANQRSAYAKLVVKKSKNGSGTIDLLMPNDRMELVNPTWKFDGEAQ